MRRLIFTVLLVIAGAFTSPSQAQPYPNKPIRLVVPFGPGSGADIIARILADRMSEQMSQRVIVENRDGAGGAIGSTMVGNSPPDGYTLLLIPSSFTVNLLPTPPYDPVKNFVAVSKVASLPLALVSGVDVPFKTFPELIAYAQANPGKLNYATSGKGASSHLEMELLKYRYKLDIPDVPYKSFGQAIADTMSGQVSFYFAAFPATLPHLKSGKVRGIAMGALQRSSQAPEVPTIAEALNLPGYEASVWYGVMAPAGTPPEIVATIDAQIAKALEVPEVQAKFEKAGVLPAHEGPRRFGPVVREETEKWGKLVNELGLKSAH